MLSLLMLKRERQCAFAPCGPQSSRFHRQSVCPLIPQPQGLTESSRAAEQSATIPERFAQEAVGNNSKAVDRAYAHEAKVKLRSLESYERQVTDGRIIRLPSQSSGNRPVHFGQEVG
jgi:hypothetical protein